MDEKRIERLASLLRDSECWEHPRWQGGNAPHCQRETIAALLKYGPGDNDTAHAHWHALRAAIEEVESGAVMGSETRCAVCGADVATLDEWPRERTWLCGEHSADWQLCCASLRRARREVQRGDCEVTKDWTIRTLIRARKLYRAEKAKGKPAPRLRCEENCDAAYCMGLRDVHGCPGYHKPYRPIREWGTKCPTWTHDHTLGFGQASALGLWRARLSRGEIRCVPAAALRCTRCNGPVVATPVPGVYLCANPACRVRAPEPSPWFKREMRFQVPADAFQEAVRLGVRPGAPPIESVFPGYPVDNGSGNPRGDDFLRDLWRREEERTAARREFCNLRDHFDERLRRIERHVEALSESTEDQMRALSDEVRVDRWCDNCGKCLIECAQVGHHLTGCHGWRPLPIKGYEPHRLALRLATCEGRIDGLSRASKPKPKARKAGK